MRWIALVLVVLPCGCAEELLLRHDTVQLDFARGQSQDTTPFPTTAEVVATLEYDECLISYYRDHPNMRQDGVDGALAFGRLDDGGEGWMDRLCDDDTGPHAACEVVSIEQELDIPPPRLTVTYAIAGELEGRQLNFGPLPRAAVSRCPGGALPVVRMGSVTGTDENGELLWATETFDPSSAVVGQGGAITIYASAPE